MIEVFLKERGQNWDLKASILPYGGLGLSREAVLASLSEPSFVKAADALQSLSTASFRENPDRWPVSEPKFLIINQGTNPDPKNYGNYKVVRGDKTVGEILNFSRASHLELIKEALKLITAQED